MAAGGLLNQGLHLLGRYFIGGVRTGEPNFSGMEEGLSFFCISLSKIIIDYPILTYPKIGISLNFWGLDNHQDS